MKRILQFICFNTIFIVIDQITKYLAQTKLKESEGISIIDGVFRLHYVENTGSAFGMMQNKIWFLVPVTILVVAGLVYAYFKYPSTTYYRPLHILLIFLTSGAVGNLIDRMVHQYVIDFFYFELIDFPVFNVADCYVVVSCMLLLILGFFYYKEEDFDLLFQKKS